ncbi:MAG: hypothetical protein QXS48_04405 [Candidatus Aenigmatarchaeota archaeon]
MEKAFYSVIFLTIIITVIGEIIFQLTYKTTPLLTFVYTDSVFLILGFANSIVSVSLYKTFLRTKEISTVNFMLAPKKLKEEIKFFHTALRVVFVGWLAYLVELAVHHNFPELFIKYELIFSILYNSYIFSSIFLALTTVVIFYRWRRRILTYE